MNRFSLTRKLQVYVLNHPAALERYVRLLGKRPSLPRGYRKIVKK